MPFHLGLHVAVVNLKAVHVNMQRLKRLLALQQGRAGLNTFVIVCVSSRGALT